MCIFNILGMRTTITLPLELIVSCLVTRLPCGTRTVFVHKYSRNRRQDIDPLPLGLNIKASGQTGNLRNFRLFSFSSQDDKIYLH
jgi:hypothetical protein